MEFNAEDPDHIGLVILLATLCDPTPSAALVLGRVRGSRQLAQASRRRLVDSLARRMGEARESHQILGVLDEALCLPSTDPIASAQRATIVMEATAYLQPSIEPAARAFFGDAVRTRELGAPPLLAAYHNVARMLNAPVRRIARAHIAEQQARALAPSVHTEVARLRSELRAEQCARLAGLPVRAAYLRSHRRKTLEQYRAANPDEAALLMCRPLLLCGSRIPPWPACYAALYIGVVGGRISAMHASALASAWELSETPYRIEPRMRAWLNAHLGRRDASGTSRSASPWDICERNGLARLSTHPERDDPSVAIPLGIYSLGLLGSTLAGTSTLDLSASRGALLRVVERHGRLDSLRVRGHGVSAGAATDRLCARVMLGEEIGLRMTRFLVRRLAEETAWARRVVVAKCASIAALRAGRVAWAAKIAVRARRGYEALRKLERAHRPRGPRPRLLQLYEEHCRAVLRSFSPPLRGGSAPVRALATAVRQLPPRRRRSRVRTTIAALDALVAVGRGTDARGLHDRVVRELARMVGARVLLHYEGGGYRALEHQRHHTLGTWTIRCLVRERQIRARRVRPRPEFWRPEQRRPGGVLSFPLGDGTACLARGRAFRSEEVEAVRVVLGFLRERLAEPDGVGPREGLPTTAGASESRAALRPVQGIVGNSAPWRQVMDDVWRVARGDVPVLLLGETGTGKEVVARAIHLTSGRAQRPFVAASCATLRGDTLLSELFGHVRGAFSGAVRNHKGLFERAHRGTLFLDELGEASPELQVALLRVLQDGVVRPVGSVASRDVSVRVVAATNRDLDVARRDGRFREDLYHRLATVTLQLPPLRERVEDVPLLASHLLVRHAPERALHPEALAALVAYDWPGNVRELENVLRAAALLCDDPEIPAATIRQAIDGRREARRRAVRPTHLAPRAQALLDAMRSGWWSAAELADRLALAHRTVNRELNALEERGLIEMTGEAKARRYRRQLGTRSEGSR